MMLFRTADGELRMAFEAPELEIYLRLLILRAGGSVSITIRDLEEWRVDECHLEAEATDDEMGLILSTARRGDEGAGHA